MSNISLKGLESITYTDMDVNLCWQNSGDDSESQFTFVTMPSCEEDPKVFITNNEGTFVLYFQKEGSIFHLVDNKFWYNKKNLTSITKL